MSGERPQDAYCSPHAASVDAHQKAFLTMALGGPAAYEGRGLHEAHAALTIDDYHVDRVAGHLTSVLLDLGVAPEVVDEVIAAVDGLRPTVLGGS